MHGYFLKDVKDMTNNFVYSFVVLHCILLIKELNWSLYVEHQVVNVQVFDEKSLVDGYFINLVERHRCQPLIVNDEILEDSFVNSQGPLS